MGRLQGYESIGHQMLSIQVMRAHGAQVIEYLVTWPEVDIHYYRYH